MAHAIPTSCKEPTMRMRPLLPLLLFGTLAAHPGHGSGPAAHAMEHVVMVIVAAAGLTMLIVALLRLGRRRTQQHRS